MKKIVVFIVILFFLMIAFLAGYNDNRGFCLSGEDSDFFGTWKTNSGSGSFSLVDSIRFNNDYTCDYFWSASHQIAASGT